MSNWFSGGSSESDAGTNSNWFSNGGSSSSSATSKLKKRLKDEAENRATLQAQESLTKPVAGTEPKKKGSNWFENGAKAVGNFVKDAAIDIKNTTVDSWQGIGDVARGQLATNDISQKTQIAKQRQEEYQKRFGSASEDKWRDPKFIDEVKKFNDETKKVTAVGKQSRDDVATQQKVDNKKLAASSAETFLNVATLGEGGAILQGAKSVIKQGVKTGAKYVAKGVAKETAEKAAQSTARKVAGTAAKDAVLGAGYGVTTTMRNDPNASLEDYAKNVALGATVGAAIPTAVTGAKTLKPVKAADKFIADVSSRAVSKAADTTLGKKVGNLVEKAQVAVGDSLAPVMRDFKGIVDKNGRTVNEEVRLLDGNVSNAASITEGRLKENEAFQSLGELMAPKTTRPGSLRAARKEAKDLGEFISKKQDAINNAKLGRESEIPIGTPKQEKAYDLLNKSTKHDIQYAYDGGLITKANYEKYMADTNYTRVQRDMGDEIEKTFKSTGGAAGSISKSNSFSQRLKGSNKKAVDPFVAYFDWSNKVTREVQRAKLSNYIIEQRQANGLGKGYLRKAENVEERQASYAEAAQLRVLRNGLDKAVKSESKYGRRLEQELNALNKKGLETSLKKGGKETIPKFDPKGLGGNLPTSQSGKMVPMTPEEKSIMLKTGATNLDIPTNPNKLGKKDTKSFLNSLVEADTSDLQAIKRKIANREPKLAAHIDNIIMLKEQHEIASKAVRELVEIARANGDKGITNKTTIKTLKRGIKEVYEDDPRIVDAINKVGRVELHALIKVAQAPSKVIQRTATALNFVFTASNLVKDQVSSAVLSKNVAATHNPVSFMTGLKEAALKPTGRALLRGVGARKTADKVLKPTKEYEQFLKFVAGSTRTDIARNLKSTARRTYETLGLKNNSPIRKVEDINSATENLTRFQNYIGTYKKALKDGLDSDTAQKNAIQAARENSVDFSRSGDWGPIMKIFNPYANANIQGSRSLIRAAKERPVSTSLKLATTIMAPMAAATYWNLSDPKRALIYSELPDSDKENNLIFITSDGSILKMPTPPGIKEIGKPVRHMIEAEYGAGNPDSFLKTAKALFVDTVNPFSQGVGEGVPQFVKPAVEAWSNKSFFTGKAIVPDYLKEKDTTDQVFKTTSQTYRDVGDKFGISPLIAKQIITGYTSSVGEQSISLYDKLRKAGGATGKDGNPIVTDKRDTVSQLKGKFREDKPDQKAKASELFFSTYTPLRSRRDKASKEVTELIKAGRRNEAKRKADEFNQSLVGSFNTYQQRFGNTEADDPDLKELRNNLVIKTGSRSFESRSKQ